MLTEMGIETDFANNGQEAIEKLSQAPYDLALIDVQMPIVDGFGVAAWVKQEWHGLWSPPSLIAVSATAMEQVKAKCLSLGMVDFIAKPVDLEDLQQTVARHGQLGLSDLRADRLESPRGAQPSAPPFDPSANRTPLSDYVDWKNFDSVWELSNANEDPSVLETLLNNYRRESEEILSRVEKIAAEDLPQARRLLHKLRGSTGSLGLKGAFTRIEDDPDDESMSKVARTIGSIPEIRRSTERAFLEIARRYPSLNLLPPSGDSPGSPQESSKSSPPAED